MAQNMMMAQVIEEPYKMTYQEVPVPEIQDDEVLVRVRVVGLTAADWSLYSGALGAGSLPVIPGHEFWGEVEELGADVRGLGVGDRVAADTGPATSLTCLTGRADRCESEAFTQCDVPDGPANGGFAQYAAVRAASCCVIPADLDDYTAAFIKPLASVIRAFDYVHTGSGGACVLLGCDLDVALFAAYARIQGYAPVIVVSAHEPHLKCALQMGADFAIQMDSPDSTAKEIRKITGAGDIGCMLEIADPAQAAKRARQILGGNSASPAGGLGLALQDHPESSPLCGNSWARALNLLKYQHIDPKAMWSVAVPLKKADTALREMHEDPGVNKVFVVPTLREDFVFPAARQPVGATIRPAAEE